MRAWVGGGGGGQRWSEGACDICNTRTVMSC